MADLISWFKGAGRQLNPFDNGATFSNPNPALRVHQPVQVPQVNTPIRAALEGVKAAGENIGNVYSGFVHGIGDFTGISDIANNVTYGPALSKLGQNPNLLPSTRQDLANQARGAAINVGLAIPKGIVKTVVYPLQAAGRLVGSTIAQGGEAIGHPITPNIPGVGTTPSFTKQVHEGGYQALVNPLFDSLAVLGAGKYLKDVAPGIKGTAREVYDTNPILSAEKGSVPLGGKTPKISPEKLASQKALEYAKDPNNFTAKGEFKANIQKELNDIVNGKAPSTSSVQPAIKNYRPGIPVEPTQTVNPVVAKLANKTTVLEKIGTPSSQLAADKMRAIPQLTGDLRAGYRNASRTVLSLNPDEINNLGDVIEHGAKPINDKVAQAVVEAKTTLPKVLQDYTSSGGKTGNIQNYFPRDYSGLKKGSSTYNQALQHLLDSGQAKSTGEAVTILDGLRGKSNTAPGFFGAFDRSRYDVPGYTYSKNAYENYLNGAAQRTAEVTHFGPKGEVAKQLVGKIAREGGDAQLANKSISNFLNTPNSKDYLAPARGVFGAARLGKAAISHLGQSTNIPLVTRLRDLPVAITKSLTKEGKDYIRESDVNNPANIHGLTQQETSVKGVLNKVTATGLSPVMKVNRGLAALAGREYGGYLAKTGDVTGLRELGVTGDIGKTLTHEQELQASRGLANKTMFSPSRSTTPVGAETPSGKTIGQYRTAYAYKQTGLIWNNVIKAAGRGDLKPLAKFLALSAPVGVGTVAIKNAISGRKEGPGGIALDALGALGGIPGELALQTLRYGRGNILKTAAGAVAPLAGEAVDIGQRAQAAIQGKPEQLERYGLGLVPVIGSRLAHTILPTVTEQKAAAEKSSSEVTQLKSGKFYAKDLKKEFDSQEAADRAIFIDKFKKGNQKVQEHGNQVYLKNPNNEQGYSVKSKIDYEFDRTDSKLNLEMDRARARNDIQSWFANASKKYQALETKKKGYDPATDQDKIDSITLKQENLLEQSNKYKEYGGFTKPKTGRVASVASLKIANPKIPKVAGVRIRQASFKAPTTRKLSVSKIPKISSKINKRRLA